MSATTGTNERLAEFFANLDLHSGDRSLTHNLHPYPAKFIPPIARTLILELSHPGDTVLDPMCGSGTTALEAIANGRLAQANDINPVATLVTRAKTTALSKGGALALDNLLREFVSFKPSGLAPVPNFHNINHWFSHGAIKGLSEIKYRLDAIPPGAVRDLCLTVFSAVVVPLSNQESETRWRRIDKGVEEVDVYRRFTRKLATASEQISRLSDANPPLAEVHQGDARRLRLDDGSVDLVVTSPPYANSHDYYLYNKLRLFWLGEDVKPVQEAEFGSRNKHSDYKAPFDDYLAAMRQVLGEIKRVLKPNGKAAIVVGDAVIRGDFFEMSEHFAPLAEDVGLELVGHHRFHQQKYTRAFGKGFGTTHRKETHVLIYAAR